MEESAHMRHGTGALTVRPLLFCTWPLTGGGCPLEQGGIGYDARVHWRKGKHWFHVVTYLASPELSPSLPWLGSVNRNGDRKHKENKYTPTSHSHPSTPSNLT